MTGTKKELIERVADGKTLGAIPTCTECGGGKLRFDPRANEYTCPGYMEDDVFKRCNRRFVAGEITRGAWQDP